MYSYEERLKAVELYIKYNNNSAAVIRELGYPNRGTLRLWVKEFNQEGSLHEKYKDKSKYSDEQRKYAVNYYLEHGRSISKTIRAIGYPNRYTLSLWLQEDVEGYHTRPIAKSSKAVYTEDEKKEAVIHTEIREKSVNDIAEDYGVTRVTLYKWKEELLGSESECTMKKQDQDTITNRSTSEETDQLKQEVERLRKEVYRLQLEKDILEKAAQIIKKEKGINLNELTNKEKTILIDALKEKYPLKELLIELKISKSSYFYQENAMKLGDKFPQLFFTTHDTGLLNLDMFRRDQIWFTELKEDRSTDLYSLAEIQNVRKDENIRKGYINGKYGAIPMLNLNFENIILSMNVSKTKTL